MLGTALILACTLVLGAPATSSAAAAGSGRERLPGHQGLVPPGATLVGPAPTTTSLPLVVTLKPTDPAALAAEVQAVSDPGSPEYRHFLTPSQFAQRFGPTPATIAQVTSTLRQEGLTVGTPSATGLSLPVSSTVAQVQSAFSTPISKYRLSSGKTGIRQRGRTRGALHGGAPDPGHPRARHPQPPAAIDERARGEPGRGTRPTPAPRPATLAPGQPSPQTRTAAPTSISRGEGHVSARSTPPSWPRPTRSARSTRRATTGRAATIALVEMAGAGYSPSDISTFASCYGITLGPTARSRRFPSAAAGATGAGTAEAELDIETALSLAPQANIEVYEGGRRTVSTTSSARS